MRILTLLILVVSLAFLQAAAEKNAKTGKPYDPPIGIETAWGPDAFGYTALDSNEPGGPSVEWIDISAIGTVVTGLGDDNIVGPYNVGFPFRFYWYDVTTFHVGSNGYLRFSGGGQLSDPFTSIPNSAAPNDLICPFTTDFDPSSGGTVYYWSNNVDTLIVSYEHIPAWLPTGSSGDHNFQIVLSMVDTSITFNIGPQSGALNNTNGMVGIENNSGEYGIQNYPNNLIPANYSIKFYYPATILLDIHDVGVAQVQNESNGGFFVKTGDDYQANAVIKNFGNQDESGFNAIAEVLNHPAGTVVHTSTVPIASLLAGEALAITFPDVWTLDTPGNYVIRVRTDLTGDMVASNDNKRVRFNVVDLPGELSFDDGSNENLWSWNGGNGGMGIYYQPPSYPVKVTELSAFLGAGTDVTHLELFDDDGPNGQPGTQLYTTSVNQAVQGWAVVDLSAEDIVINDGGVYAAWRMNSTTSSALGIDVSTLASRRTWEYTGVWAVFRNFETDDAMLRVAVEEVQGPVFFDDFESGAGNWTGDWGLTTAASNSPVNSFTDSPGGNYPPNANLVAAMASGVDLSGYFGATLEFYTKYELETGFDYGYLEASTDGGASWLSLKTYNGEGVVTTFTLETVDIGAFAGSSDFRVRFRVVTDGGYETDGWYIDDVKITGLSDDVSAPLIVFDPPQHYQGTPADFQVVATITDLSGVATAELNYWVDDPLPVIITIPPSSVVGDDYTFDIPTQPHGSKVYFNIFAEDGATSPNSVTTADYAYVSGQHEIYDDGDPEFIVAVNPGGGMAVRFDAPSATYPNVAAALLRIYTDVNNPIDSVTVHVWTDNGGTPGTDLMTPFKVYPGATLASPQDWTIVNLSELSVVPGAAYWVGYVNTSGIAMNHLYDQPAVYNRSASGVGSWTAFAGDFHIRSVLGGPTTGIVDNNTSIIPTAYALGQNYPNPFNPSTTIKYALPENSEVTVEVYNMLGERVATLISGFHPAGIHSVQWDASSLSSGVYFYRLAARSSSGQQFTQVQKMILMK